MTKDSTGNEGRESGELSLVDAIAVTLGVKRIKDSHQAPAGAQAEEPPDEKHLLEPGIFEPTGSNYDPIMAEQILKGMFGENKEALGFLSAVLNLQKDIPDLGSCISQAVNILGTKPQAVIADLRRALLTEPGPQEKVFEQEILGSLVVDSQATLGSLENVRNDIAQQEQVIKSAQEALQLLRQQESEAVKKSEELEQKLEARKQSYHSALSAVKRQLQAICNNFQP